MDDDPIARFLDWYHEAVNAAVPAPDAMVLATVGAGGRPSARVVLYRGVSAGGLRFFTNYESRKGEDLAAHPFAAVVFHWAQLERQLRVEGAIEKLPGAESDEYFRSRPRGHQLNAWASPQSRPIEGLAELVHRREALEAQYADREVPRPPHWGGYRLVPARMEFWTSGADRFHQRELYERRDDGRWSRSRLGP
jgi:pyridoxamine 5'-phosphate oxidase